MSVNGRYNGRVDFGGEEHGVDASENAISRPEASPIRRSLVPARVGRLQLDTARFALTAEDLAILNSLAAYRLATTDQLARLHFADRRTASAGQWACRAALRKLVSLGLVTHLDRRVGGKRAGSASYVWRLRSAGWRILDRANRVYVGRKEPSLFTLDHMLAVTETAVQLREAERRGALEVIELTPEPACWRTHLNAGGGLATLKPDMFAVTAVLAAEFEDVWFIEVDMGTESLPTIQRKAGVYETYWRTGKEQAAQGTFPRVLWLTPDDTRAERITDALSPKSTGHVRHVAIARERLIELVALAAETSVSSTVKGTAASTDKPAGEAEVRHE